MSVWLTDYHIKNPRSNIPHSSPVLFQNTIWYLFKREKISKKACFSILSKHWKIFVSKPKPLEYYTKIWNIFVLLYQITDMGPHLRKLKDEIRKCVGQMAFRIALKKEGILDDITQQHWFEMK